MINIDMWYKDNPQGADRISIFFNDCDCYYWGNIYKNGKTIGDYTADSSAEIEKAFKQLSFSWDL